MSTRSVLRRWFSRCRCRSYHRRTRMHAVGCPKRIA